MSFARPVITRRFAMHYVEMVVAMLLGMVVLGIPAEWALGAVGSGWERLTDDAPAAMLALMAFTMTVPMCAWMVFRGHGARPTAEMAAAMIVPTIGVIALLDVGAVTETGTLLVVEHVAMLAGMFLAMAARPGEYAHHHHHAAA